MTEITEADPPTPLGALMFRMEQAGYTQADLARVIGHRAHASEILAGKRQLSKAHIAALVDTWGIPARSLLGPDATNWKARAITAERSLKAADARVIELEREVAKLRRLLITPTGDA